MIGSESQSGNTTRKPRALDARLNNRLVSYATAASAAGVGMLAWAQPADAEIVYTPANTPILIHVPVGLDLNNDGVVDFELSNNSGGFAKSCTICTYGEHASLRANPAQAGNAVWVIPSSSHRGSKLRRKKMKSTKNVAAPVIWGAVVGAEREFQAAPTVMDSANSVYYFGGGGSTNTLGLWGKGKPIVGPFLGLKFTVGGEVHYGWARIAVHADFLTITATLKGYAYETVPDRPIITGYTNGPDGAAAETNPADLATQPGGLGHLALGATGRPVPAQQ